MRNNRRDNNKKTEMYDAVCSDCGKDCKVPFKPTSGKPIYCSSCFEKYDKKDSGDRKPRRDSRKSHDRDMYSAVCDKCGKDCKVPFKPSSDKPIYCSDCFEQVNENKKDSGDRKPRRDSRRSNDRDMYSAVCDKCGKDCKVPFKPSSDKPIYCSDCFEQINENKNGANTELLEKIDKKLDYIVETLKYGKGRY